MERGTRDALLGRLVYSAGGYYFDAHDRDAMCRVLLDPLGPDGDRRFRTAVYHHAVLPIATAPADAVLFFDGVFLLRPELVARWDLSILMSVTFDRTVDRAPGPRHGTRRTRRLRN